MLWRLPLTSSAVLSQDADNSVHEQGRQESQEVRMFVNVHEGESFEELYRRFKRGLEASGIFREYRRKQRFKPAHEVRRDRIRAAARKLRRARGRRSD